MRTVKSWDVIIVGGGIIGLSLARELRKRSASVLVVERGMPGREASHSAAGMLAISEVSGPLQSLGSASFRMYPEFVHELQDESGVDVDFRQDGTLQFGDSDLAEPALRLEQIREMEPNLAPVQGGGVLLQEASVDPRGLVSAALQACKHRGVDTSSGDEVTAIDMEGERAVGITTAKTRFAARAVVNCAGAWAGLLSTGGFPTRPVKGQMLAVALPSRNFLRHVIRAPEVYLVPRTDGRLLIGATVEEAGYDKRVDPATIHRLRQSAIALMPALSESRILESWAGLRPGTPDSLPILGATQVPGYFVATGHFRDGILMTPVTARAMAQVVSGDKCGYDLRPFSADRFGA